MKLAKVIAVASLMLASACVVKADPATSGTTPTGTPPPAGSDGYQGDGPVAVAPGCDYPENHCLPTDVVLVAKKPYEKGHIYLNPARQTGEPGPTGEATFLATNNGKDLVSKFFHLTRPAATADLKIGKIAIMVHRQEAGFYRKPRDTKEALGNRWWMARITDVGGMSQGYVQVAGGYRIHTDAIRVLPNDSSPLVTINEAQDAQFLSADHWIISKKPLPAQRFIYGTVAVAIQAPSQATKNEGHFIRVNNGKILWTPHAWKTRPATTDDLKVGTYIFMPHIQSGGVYQNGKDRIDNTKRRWWISKIVDNSEAFKGVVQVAGGYKISTAGIRVAY